MKSIIKCFFTILTLILLTSCAGNELSALPLDTPLADIPGEGSYPIPMSLDEIEEQTENIVLVTMKGIHHLGELDPTKEEYQWTLTIAQVEVKDVVKGMLEVGDSIYVGEPYYISQGKDLQRIGGYVPMSVEQDYLLFLSNQTNESWLENPVDSWTINFLGFGQYHPNKEASFYSDSQSRQAKGFDTYSDLTNYDFVATGEEEVEQYLTIRKEIERKYFSIFQ